MNGELTMTAENPRSSDKRRDDAEGRDGTCDNQTLGADYYMPLNYRPLHLALVERTISGRVIHLST